MNLPTKAQLAPLTNRLWRVSRIQRALMQYDALTGGDIRADNEARPVVAGELASALSINFDEASQLLADALARRAAMKPQTI